MKKSPENPEIPEKVIEEGSRKYGLEARYNEQEIEARWNKINADLSVFVHNLKQVEKTNPEIAKSGLAKLDNMLNIYADIIEMPEKLDPKIKEALSEFKKDSRRVIKIVIEGRNLKIVPDVSDVVGGLCRFFVDNDFKKREFANWMIEDAGYILGPETLKNEAANQAGEMQREREEEQQREGEK